MSNDKTDGKIIRRGPPPRQRKMRAVEAVAHRPHLAHLFAGAYSTLSAALSDFQERASREEGLTNAEVRSLSLLIGAVAQLSREERAQEADADRRAAEYLDEDNIIDLVKKITEEK